MASDGPRLSRTARRALRAVVCSAVLSSAVLHGQLVEVARLDPSGGAPGDDLGRTLDLSGDTALVGPVDGWLFEADAGGRGAWGETGRLDVGGGAISVAIDRDTAAVGLPLDDTAGTNAGAVAVFRREVGLWSLEALVTSPDPRLNNEFGRSVDLSGDTLVVGAHRNGIVFDDGGHAYVFHRDAGGAGNWGPVARLEHGELEEVEGFGRAVALHRRTAVVGMARADGYSGPSAFAIYERDAGGPAAWGMIRAQRGAEPGDLGYSVAIHGERVVVGAPRSGRVHVYERDAGAPGAWGEVAVLGGEPGRIWFGSSVAVHGEWVLVGSPFEAGGGAVHLYSAAAGWARVQTLFGVPRSLFGIAVALDGRRALVGACGEAAGAEPSGRRVPTGPEYDPCRGAGTGTAHVFELAEASSARTDSR